MRRIALLALCLVAILGHAAPVAAGGGGDATDAPPTSSGRKYGATAVAGVPSAGSSPQGKKILAGCAIVTPLGPNEILDYVGAVGQGLVPFDVADLPEDTFFHFVDCPSAPFAGVNWYVWEIGDPVPPAVVEAVALAAYNESVVPLPNPMSSPEGSLAVPLLVQVETWFWTDEALWQPASVTASIPEFNIAVTATVAPTQTIWEPGDGSPAITCERGDTWSSTAGDTTPCGHVYTSTTQHDGLVEPFALNATITWTLTYTCVPVNNCTGPPNVPGTITTEVTREIYVTEIKGLLTR